MFTTRVAQSALDPAGQQAVQITHLWWLMFWICAAVLGGVLLFVAVAVTRRRAPVGERELGRAVGAAVGATVVILFVWLVISVWTAGAMASTRPVGAVTINVTGWRWWWEIEYQDLNNPSLRFKTANEIHIPVGHPVVVNVTSRDVIHSFWVPNLTGKRDLVPGYTT